MTGPEVAQVGERGSLWRFDGACSPFDHLTCVYVIRGARHSFVLDTHVGPRSMAPIRASLADSGHDARPVVFNSHFDWDHVWGNGAFPGSPIVAHARCREVLAEDALWDHMARSFGSCMHGEVTRMLPNLTFADRLTFEEDGVTFFHTPGHTEDSSSCLDSEGTLFVGDNLEDPIPCLQWHELETYRSTLLAYKELDPARILASHGGLVGPELIDRNVVYLEAILAGETPRLPEVALEMHGVNQRLLLFSKAEARARERLGPRFRLEDLIAVFEPAFEEPLARIEEVLEAFLEGSSG